MAKVLIVEDDPLLRDAFRIIIERTGHSVQVAANGQDALKVITRFGPDIILLDLLMPIMGGLEFLEKYRELNGKSSSAIIILSNMGDQQQLEKARVLGAQQYILKSEITPSKLVALIDEV